MTAPDAYQIFLPLLGGNVVSIDVTPDQEQLVIGIRPLGKKARRWVSLQSSPYGLVASELKAGCRVLTQIERAKFVNDSGHEGGAT